MRLPSTVSNRNFDLLRNQSRSSIPIIRPLSLIRNVRFAHTETRPTPPSRVCPSCSKDIAIHITPCSNCSDLLPLPTNLSLYSLLYLSSPVSKGNNDIDIPLELSYLNFNGFKLNKNELRLNWLKRQKELHPDKFSSKGDLTINKARELSGRINNAYNVLGDELKRTEYLLSIHNKATDETDKIDDPMMLAEILEAREELEEAASQDEIQRIRDVNHEKVEDIIKQLEQAFSENPPNIEEAKNLSVQLRYWKGLENAAKEKSV
ncbi:Fe-S protein assembly co-chaperone HscB [Kwoniella dendrophila CBS 6074]|uniref:Fe-S protein assembly co-chaperone HscB n=1 Tax=Kwoniella dendrophila CBS 6074 TaxID=1295534 RepID=A0AAX4K2F4_9TREE